MPYELEGEVFPILPVPAALPHNKGVTAEQTNSKGNWKSWIECLPLFHFLQLPSIHIQACSELSDLLPLGLNGLQLLQSL